MNHDPVEYLFGFLLLAGAALVCFVVVKGCENASPCSSSVHVMNPNIVGEVTCDPQAKARIEVTDKGRIVFCDCPPVKECK